MWLFVDFCKLSRFYFGFTLQHFAQNRFTFHWIQQARITTCRSRSAEKIEEIGTPELDLSWQLCVTQRISSEMLTDFDDDTVEDGEAFTAAEVLQTLEEVRWVHACFVGVFHLCAIRRPLWRDLRTTHLFYWSWAIAHTSRSKFWWLVGPKLKWATVACTTRGWVLGLPCWWASRANLRAMFWCRKLKMSVSSWVIGCTLVLFDAMTKRARTTRGHVITPWGEGCWVNSSKIAEFWYYASIFCLIYIYLL